MEVGEENKSLGYIKLEEIHMENPGEMTVRSGDKKWYFSRQLWAAGVNLRAIHM